ncbi:DEAD-domain-containing protein, partial [Neoconidiobolus thromboides FSU 785]
MEDLNLSPLLQSSLKKNKIESLFSIQTDCFKHIVEGKDLVGRARTGTGKTLAFALPVIEKLERNKLRSRTPRVLILAPTRELASQVEKEITKLVANSYSTLCIYGGSPYRPQENKLREGVDIVVGTPGRVQDLINKGHLKLTEIETLILDEADHMLDIGFSKELDDIINCVRTQRIETIGNAQPFQFLLFSATLPEWIKKTIRKYLSKDYITVDHVGDESLKASKNVKQLAIPTLYKQIPTTIAGLLQGELSKSGRCVVFCQTKSYCDTLVTSLNKLNGVNAIALHGDVSQSSREIALNNFKSGKISCLVATDVAARGLDISNVELVIQAEPPNNPETFIHRSGRTGRAGNFGTNVMLFNPKQDAEIYHKIQQHTGVQFKIVRAPTMADFRASIFEDFMKSISRVKSVNNEIKKLISSQYNNLPENIKENPELILATCFEASIKNNPSLSGAESRSLIDATDGKITLIIEGTNRTGDLLDLIYKNMKLDPEEVKMSNISPLKQGSGIVFDVSYNSLDNIMEGMEKLKEEDEEYKLEVKVCEELPEVVKANALKQLNDRKNKKFGQRTSVLMNRYGNNERDNNRGFNNRDRNNNRNMDRNKSYGNRNSNDTYSRGNNF